jgi:uncharacterized membrane protein YdbT with pleckstrin-like domain
LNFKSYLLSGLTILALLAALAALSAMSPSPLGDFKGPAQILLAVLLVFPLLHGVQKYLEVRFRKYVVSTERLRISRGILSKRTDNLELYRVDDIILEQPILLRLVSRGTVRLATSDRTNPDAVIEAIPHAPELRDQVRRYVEVCRDRKRVRVVDIEEQNL